MPYYSKALPAARRLARERAEAFFHLPLEEARQRARSAARRAGTIATYGAIPKEERRRGGDGNDGYTITAVRRSAEVEALRTLYAAMQPGVEEAPIHERETRSVSLEILFDDDVREDKDPAEYIAERGISEKVFCLPIWGYVGLALEMMTPWVEGQPAVKRLGPGAKRYGDAKHVEEGKEAYIIGYMRRSAGEHTRPHFQPLLKGSQTLTEARKFVEEHGQDAVDGGDTFLRGWRRLLDHLE